MIRTLIADDEPLARRRLRGFLSGEKDVEVVGECADGDEVVRMVEKASPHLVFLDIKMPKRDGFGVVEAVGAENMPLTVFVTAFDQYALRAFDCHAIDYLLKPFSEDRFHDALGHVRQRLRQSSRAEVNRRMSALVDEMSGREEYVDRLLVKSASRLVLLKVEEIDWIDAAGNYVRLNTDGKKYLLREKISALEKKLDPRVFVRIHRSTIVNLESVREIQPLQHGEGLVVLADGQQLNLSRSYRDKLTSHLS